MRAVIFLLALAPFAAMAQIVSNLGAEPAAWLHPRIRALCPYT